MIDFGTQFLIWLLFLFQLSGFLIVMWIIVRLIAYPVHMLWDSMRTLFDREDHYGKHL